MKCFILLVLYFYWLGIPKRTGNKLCHPAFLCISQTILLTVSFGFRPILRNGSGCLLGDNIHLDIGKSYLPGFTSLLPLPLSYQMAGNDATIFANSGIRNFHQSFAAFIRGIVWSDIVSLMFLFLWVEIRKRIHLPVICGFHWAFGLRSCLIRSGIGFEREIPE